MIGKIKYALYVVKLNAQNFILSHTDHTAQNHARHPSSAASVHRRHELGRLAAAFFPICVDKWRKRLGVGIRVKV